MKKNIIKLAIFGAFLSFPTLFFLLITNNITCSCNYTYGSDGELLTYISNNDIAGFRQQYDSLKTKLKYGFDDLADAYWHLSNNNIDSSIIYLDSAEVHLPYNLNNKELICASLKFQSLLGSFDWKSKFEIANKITELYQPYTRIEKEYLKAITSSARVYKSLLDKPPCKYHAPEKVTLPIISNEQELIIITATIQGNSYQFMVDTGLDEIIMKKSVLDEINFTKLRGSELQQDISGYNRKIRKAFIDKIAFGDAIFENIPVGVIEDNLFGAGMMLDSLSGIIGFTVLNKFGKITIINGEKISIEKSEKDLKSDPTSNMFRQFHYPVAEITFNNKTLSAMLDTGTENSYFFSPFYDLIKDSVELEEVNSLISTPYNLSLQTYMQLPQITFTIENQNVTIYDSFVSVEKRSGFFKVDAILGQNFFSSFDTITFDYNNMIYELKGYEEKPQKSVHNVVNNSDEPDMATQRRMKLFNKRKKVKE